ncbi:MAG: hypothetical protein DDT19_00264 [Syntrophomonadaceae bacterium]|nr:hypothetical protein [Bacillota bacterium]
MNREDTISAFDLRLKIAELKTAISRTGDRTFLYPGPTKELYKNITELQRRLRELKKECAANWPELERRQR